MPPRTTDSEIDDLSLPELPLIRWCQVYQVPGDHRTAAKRKEDEHKRCREPARPGGKTCHAHYREAMQRWRARRKRAGEPYGLASPTAPSSSTAAGTARVALHREIKYGLVAKGPCVTCNARQDVIAVRRDQSKPGEYVWACRTHRRDLIRERTEAQEAREREAARIRETERMVESRKTALDLLAAAPADVQAAIHAEVGAMMLGPMRLQPGTPIYNQKLAQLAEARLRPQE